MLYLIDSANIEEIKKCVDFFPIHGVTTNPTIIAHENTDFIKLIKDIRDVIGPDKMLHIQTTATTAENILREALAIKKIVDGELYIKITISPEGLKAMRELKKIGIKSTATAIFTQQQAMLAALAGADFVAPYVNRLDNVVADGAHVVEEIVKLFDIHNINCKVLAASFKNAEQVHKIALDGGHAVTLTPDLYWKLAYYPLTDLAVKQFTDDWNSVYKDKTILDLLEK